MKNMRKLLSLVFALMLLLSLSVNAFAAENAATINITVEGEPYITQPIDSAISVKAALRLCRHILTSDVSIWRCVLWTHRLF